MLRKNLKKGVAEGLEDSNIQTAIVDTVERLFRKNEISDYGALESVRQGVKHHFSKPGATIESAVEGILNILDKRMRKSGNYVDLGRFKEALRQGVAHQLKKQGMAEAELFDNYTPPLKGTPEYEDMTDFMSWTDLVTHGSAPVDGQEAVKLAGGDFAFEFANAILRHVKRDPEVLDDKKIANGVKEVEYWLKHHARNKTVSQQQQEGASLMAQLLQLENVSRFGKVWTYDEIENIVAEIDAQNYKDSTQYWKAVARALGVHGGVKEFYKIGQVHKRAGTKMNIGPRILGIPFNDAYEKGYNSEDSNSSIAEAAVKSFISGWDNSHYPSPDRPEWKLDGVKAISTYFNMSDKIKTIKSLAEKGYWEANEEDDYPRGQYLNVKVTDPKHFEQFLSLVYDMNPNHEIFINSK
jgi:hypothetical protein